MSVIWEYPSVTVLMLKHSSSFAVFFLHIWINRTEKKKNTSEELLLSRLCRLINNNHNTLFRLLKKQYLNIDNLQSA